MKNFKFDVDYVRDQFPRSAVPVNGNPAAFLTAPAAAKSRAGWLQPSRIISFITMQTPAVSF